MNLPALVARASDKTQFTAIEHYIEFARLMIDFSSDGLQAEIVCQNEDQYRFWQFKRNGNFNISRPLNSNLLYDADSSSTLSDEFLPTLAQARDIPIEDAESRSVIANSI